MSFNGALDMIRDQHRTLGAEEALASIRAVRWIRAEAGPELDHDERSQLLALERDIRGAKR